MRSFLILAAAVAVAGCAHGPDHKHRGGHAGHGHHGHAKGAQGEGHPHHGHKQAHREGHHRHGHKAHGMPHRFEDAAKWSKIFDDPKRDAWQRPEQVIAQLKLDPGAVVANIGAGTGYFTIRFAKLLQSGRVYAIDLETSLLDHLAKRAKKEGLEERITAVIATPTDPKIPQKVDVVFLCNTYHHIGDRTAYFKRVSTSLNAKGRLVLVEFKSGKLPVGPPERHRVTPSQVDSELQAAGYRRVSLDMDTLPYQYIATYQRQ